MRTNMRLATRFGCMLAIFLAVSSAATRAGGGDAELRRQSPRPVLAETSPAKGTTQTVAYTPPPEPAGPPVPPKPLGPEVPPKPEGPQVPPRAAKVLKKIPILMYHEIGDQPNNNYVSRQTFEAQMKWLADNGYHGITLGEAYRHLYQGAEVPSRPVAITFDDGYRTFYTIVAPILQKYEFRATSFIITGLVGRPDTMTWEMVEELPTLGMEVGAHTISHPDLRTLSGERLRREIAGSKETLEEHLHRPVQFFCYPSGKYDDETVATVKAAGFLAGVTTDYGPATPDQNPLILDRVRILRTETAASFADKIKRASSEP